MTSSKSEALPADTALAQRLFLLCALYGVEKKVIAQRVGIHAVEMSHILHGRRTPSPDLAASIERAIVGDGQR